MGGAVAAMPRPDVRVGDEREATGGTVFIEQKVSVPVGKERPIFSMPVPALSRHLVSGTVLVDGPKGVELTLTLRLLNGQRTAGHFIVSESPIGAVQVTDSPVGVPVKLKGEALLVPVGFRGWCSVSGGAAVRLEVVAGRRGSDAGRVFIRGGWTAAFCPG